MRKTILLGAAVAALVATSASADIITFTWTGKVQSGVDKLKMFGTSATANMANKTFTATYVYDTLLGFVGGSQAGDPSTVSPLVSAQITINGKTISIGGAFHSGFAADKDQDSSEFTTAQDFDGIYHVTLQNQVFSYDVTRPYGDPSFNDLDVDLNSAENTSLFGSIYSFIEKDQVAGSGFEHLFLLNQHLTINRQIVTPPPPASVPEPASWAMMLGGFGLIGGALRSRRRVVVRLG
jgi:hypothetical protein